MTSLYPTTHGVHEIPHRLPVSGTTVAEVYRQAATPPRRFLGLFHRAAHQPAPGLRGGARVGVHRGRAGPRGAKHRARNTGPARGLAGGPRDVPSFVYLHVFDPHRPTSRTGPTTRCGPTPPAGTSTTATWRSCASTSRNASIQRGMATPDELAAAGIDAAGYLPSRRTGTTARSAVWTPRSPACRAHRGAGLRDRARWPLRRPRRGVSTHGSMWHGNTVYGEICGGPDLLEPRPPAQGLEGVQPVQLIDVMPRCSRSAGCRCRRRRRGQSTAPRSSRPAAQGAVAAHGVEAAAAGVRGKNPFGGGDFPGASQSFAIVDATGSCTTTWSGRRRSPNTSCKTSTRTSTTGRTCRAEPESSRAMSKTLEGWKRMAQQAQLKPDTEMTKGMSARAARAAARLGYVK